MSKKIITTAGTEFAQNGADLAMIEQTQRAGKPVMISSTDLNEGFSNAEADVKALVGFDVEGEEITVDPTTSKQTKTPSKGKNAITKVTVNAVTSAIDANIVAENIKKDVTILGVTGTHEGPAPVPEKVALNLNDTYKAIHFITEGYTIPANADLYHKIEDAIAATPNARVAAILATPDDLDNSHRAYIYYNGDSGYVEIYIGVEDTTKIVPGTPGASTNILNIYNLYIDEITEPISVSVESGACIEKLSGSLLHDGQATLQIDTITDMLDIDLLNLIAYAYADDVVPASEEPVE